MVWHVCFFLKCWSFLLIVRLPGWVIVITQCCSLWVVLIWFQWWRFVNLEFWYDIFWTSSYGWIIHFWPLLSWKLKEFLGCNHCENNYRMKVLVGDWFKNFGNRVEIRVPNWWRAVVTSFKFNLQLYL